MSADPVVEPKPSRALGGRLPLPRPFHQPNGRLPDFRNHRTLHPSTVPVRSDSLVAGTPLMTGSLTRISLCLFLSALPLLSGGLSSKLSAQEAAVVETDPAATDATLGSETEIAAEIAADRPAATDSSVPADSSAATTASDAAEPDATPAADDEPSHAPAEQPAAPTEAPRAGPPPFRPFGPTPGEGVPAAGPRPDMGRFPGGPIPGGTPPVGQGTSDPSDRGAFPGPGFQPPAGQTFPGASTPRETPGAGAADQRLSFNFSGTDWREVLRWLSDESGMSLQVDRYPPGTVNYIDNTRTYDLSGAMDVINKLLLDRGFALVRRGRLLILIDLEADNAASLISEMAELVTSDQLDSRADSDIVKCVFALGGLSPDAARVEINQLIGPSGKLIVLDSAKQVVVTETVMRLRAIRELLENARVASSEVTEIELKHRVADELLEIARPLIGLEPGVNSSDKIRIALGLYGDRIYATGDAATRELLSRIIERADTPLQAPEGDPAAAQSAPKLEIYKLSSIAPATAMDVLQTLLAGIPDTRIATDPDQSGIIAYARPETHEMIQNTLEKLEARATSFEIIQLRRLEPSQALLTINKFFGVTEANSKDAPTVDGDPVTGRLWVRGTTEQIDQVKMLIERLEGADTLGALGDRFRILPYTGRTAVETLEQVQDLWEVLGRKNKIRMVSPAAGQTDSTRTTLPQRRVGGLTAPTRGNPVGSDPVRAANTDPEGRFDRSGAPVAPVEDEAADPTAAEAGFPGETDRASDPASAAAELTFVSDTSAADLSFSVAADIAADKENSPIETQAPSITLQSEDGGSEIVIRMTPAGMIVASDDPLALSDFEQMMRTLSDESSTASAQPTVFWLKYIKAPEAADLVTKVLGGETGGGGGGGGGGLAGSLMGELGGGMLGGLLGLGGGGGGDSSGGTSVLTTTGSVSIVADGRLNALIVQANAVDMLAIETILEVIDREESPEDVRTISKPQLIPVIYQSAAEVATIVKAVYAERSGEQRAGGGQQQQISPQDLLNAIRGGGGGRGGRGGGGNEQATKPAPVSIAVDARSNSLIVTAPPQDVEDIRELVEAIDAGGMQSEETVEIVSLKGTMKPEIVQQALDSILGTKARSTTAPTSGATTGATNQPTGGGASTEDIQRRIQFFQQMQQRGGFGGGGGPPGGFGGGGGPPGGFGGGATTGGRGGAAPTGRGGTGGGGTTGRGRGGR
ncbi:MAG: general secretion pathway protein [Planctomycetaceae bacterium]|nr:MAG: general secretion pathway protein [Planctomycetaceae bacterium]